MPLSYILNTNIEQLVRILPWKVKLEVEAPIHLQFTMGLLIPGVVFSQSGLHQLRELQLVRFYAKLVHCQFVLIWYSQFGRLKLRHRSLPMTHPSVSYYEQSLLVSQLLSMFQSRSDGHLLFPSLLRVPRTLLRVFGWVFRDCDVLSHGHIGDNGTTKANMVRPWIALRVWASCAYDNFVLILVERLLMEHRKVVLVVN